MSTASASPQQQAHGFRHEAVFYAGDDAFLDATLPFIRDAVRGSEPILVAVGATKIARLTAALDGAGDRVRFADMEELGTNPARIIPAWRDFVDGHGGSGSPLRGIGEPVWPGRSDDEVAECHRHEALLNLAFTDAADFRLICPYDSSRLGSDVVAGACRSHPVVVEHGIERASRDYRGGEAIRPFAEPLDDPDGAPLSTSFEAETLNEVRRLVLDCASAGGLDPVRAEEFQLAVSEVAANSVRHAGGTGELRAWVQESTVVAEVRDRGRIVDPLAGRQRPGIDQVGGYGLWIANQLCDLVQIRSFDDGNVVRLHMRRASLATA